MKNFCILALFLSAAAGPAFGSLVFLTGPVSPIDTVDWSSVGGDQIAFGNNALGVLGSSTGYAQVGLGTQPSLGGVTSVVCPAVNPVNCSWGHQTSGYQDGDTVLWLEGQDSNQNSVGTGPLTLTILNQGFSFNPVFGLGLYLQSTSPGPFNASIALYNGALLLGSHSYASNANGDPLFLGVQDTLREITSAIFTVTSCGSFACDVNDFSVDTLDIFAAAPEPSSLALDGVVLALGFAVRKYFGKGTK
jgi:hypothetical protein